MACKWGHTDCKFEESAKCARCWTDSQNYKQMEYKQPKRLAKRSNQKADGRMGSHFEEANHKHNLQLLKEAAAETHMTLNSGATHIERGDEQLTGLFDVMQECKTQMPDRVKGTKTFTIRREWLDDLHQKAMNEKKEFWHLVFAFSEDEGCHEGGEVFVVLERKVTDKIIKSVISGRKVEKLAVMKIDVAEKMRAKAEAKVTLLERENELLKAQLKLAQLKKEG